MLYSESVYLRLSELNKIAKGHLEDEAAILAGIFDPEDGVPKDHFYDYTGRNISDLSLEVLRNGGVLEDGICYVEISSELVKIIFDLAIEGKHNDR